jgi:hypothetical protein
MRGTGTIKMASLFDDHATVVVLDEVVRRLVRAECQRNDDPDKQLQQWIIWLKKQGELYKEAGFRDGQTADTTLNAIEIAGAFDTFARELLTVES